MRFNTLGELHEDYFVLIPIHSKLDVSNAIGFHLVDETGWKGKKERLMPPNSALLSGKRRLRVIALLTASSLGTTNVMRTSICTASARFTTGYRTGKTL